MNEKLMLRKAVRCREAECDRVWREEVSNRMWETVEQLPAFTSAKRILAYWSLPSEVATHRFLTRWAGDKQIYLPVMQGDELTLRRFSSPEQLHPARFGIQEPLQGEQTTADYMDLMIIPAVGYDICGNRLGHGKGFYDRLLQSGKALKIGVCFDYQLFERIPVEAHDIPVDWVICGSGTAVQHFREGVLYTP